MSDGCADGDGGESVCGYDVEFGVHKLSSPPAVRVGKSHNIVFHQKSALFFVVCYSS